MSQKEIFKQSEGDAWFERNKDVLKKRNFEADPLVLELKHLLNAELIDANKKIDILEVGCGEGSRGQFISKIIDCNFYGIDPSKKAVKVANSKGIIASQGSADKLPYKNNQFDIIIYGFCLYLCDRQDLPLISKEASRVLKDSSWLLIMDFFSDSASENEYMHLENIKSFKMDYRKIFENDSSYCCYSHKIIDHENHQYTDIKENWISISAMRRIKR